MWIWPSVTCIFRARVGATKTLNLAVIEVRLNIFWTIPSLLGRVMDRLIHTQCRFRQKFVCQMKNNYKEIRDSSIYEKVWLKAAKSISGKWILLNSCAWNANPPPLPPLQSYSGCLPFVRINRLRRALHNGKGFFKISKPTERNGAYHLHSDFRLMRDWKLESLANGKEISAVPFWTEKRITSECNPQFTNGISRNYLTIWPQTEISGFSRQMVSTLQLTV